MTSVLFGIDLGQGSLHGDGTGHGAFGVVGRCQRGAEEREKLERDLREAARLEDSTDAGLAKVLDSAGASQRPSAPHDPAEAMPEPEESRRDGSRHAS